MNAREVVVDSLLLLVLALLIRGGVLLTPHALQDDTDGYRRLAENVVTHGTLGTGQMPTAYRPPLYPLLLAPCVALGDYGRAAIGALHVLLGAATVGLVLLVGRWWGLGRRGAALAALLTACDPILLMWSTRVMTETLATFLAVAGLATLTWASRRPTGRRAALAGAMLAIGTLCRPTLLLWTIAAGVVFGLRSCLLGRQLHCRPQPASLGCGSATTAPTSPNSRGLTAPGRILDRLRLPLAFALGALLVLSPWAIRNQRQFGRPIVTTTHGGYTLMLANNPEFYQWLRDGRWGSVWRAEGFDADWGRRRPPDELQADCLAYHEAWQTIGREPGTFAYASLVRLGRFWSPLPHQVVADETPLGRLSRWAVAVWYMAEFFFAAIGLFIVESGEWRVESGPALTPPSAFRLPPSTWLWGLLLVGCLMAAHAVYWTDMRMRAPVIPLVALAAAAGMCRRARPV